MKTILDRMRERVLDILSFIWRECVSQEKVNTLKEMFRGN